MRSVSGFILDVLGIQVSLQTKDQKSATLSSKEAEWETFSVAVKKVMFVIQLLAMVRVNNLGASFIAHNVTITMAQI